jgi:hypothetical protein
MLPQYYTVSQRRRPRLESNLEFLNVTGIFHLQSPQPADSWDGTRDALVEGPTCAQIDLLKKDFKGEEDCLYLNVYTPKVSSLFTYKIHHSARRVILGSAFLEKVQSV